MGSRKQDLVKQFLLESMLITGLASVQSIRTALANPVKTLRSK
jgi:hypothetical protein